MEDWQPGTGIAIGIALGVALGTALGNLGLGIALGVAFGAAFEHRQARTRASSDTTASPTAEQAERQTHLDAILARAREAGRITNADVQALVGVSDATAERYLDQLEAEGKLEQVGTTGRDVFYRFIASK